MKKGFTQHLFFKKKSNRKLSAGFSLMELMVAIAIIGILSAVVIPSYLSSKAKSRDSVRLGDLKSISLAIQNYWQDSGYKTWPATLNDVSTYFSGGVPKDPLGKSYVYTAFGQGLNPDGTDKNTNKKDFCISAMMETIPSSQATLSSCDQVNGTVGTDYNYNVVGP